MAKKGRLKATNQSLSPEVSSAFKNCSIIKAADREWHLSLTSTLTKPQYVEAKRIVNGLRGEWVRGKGTHVFVHDPEPEVAQMVESGNVPLYALNPHSFFPTDVIDIRSMIIDIAQVDRHQSGLVLEPQAGDGRIIVELLKINTRFEIHYCEIDERNRQILSGLPATLVGEDFLEYRPQCKYRYIFSNPPFNGTEYQKHFRHAFSMLEVGGSLIAIAPTMAIRDREFRDWLFADGGGLWCETEGEFEGTKIQCLIIEKTNQCPSLKQGVPYGFYSWAQYAVCIALDSDARFWEAQDRLKRETADPKKHRARLSSIIEDAVNRIVLAGASLSLASDTLELVVRYYNPHEDYNPDNLTPSGQMELALT